MGMGKKSKNENCLAGVRCPKCKQEDFFKIAGTAMFSVTDAGADYEGGDIDWDESSLCVCSECKHTGLLGEFYISNQKKPPKTSKAKVGFPEPKRCEGCGVKAGMTLQTVSVNQEDGVPAWVCDDCGYAHLTKGGK